MRTEQVSIYKFEELSDSAKEKAREWYRNGALDYEWWDSVYKDAERVFKILGIDATRNGKSPAIYWSGFHSQGDGACFEGSYRYQAGSVRAMYRHAPKDEELNRIALELMLVQRRNGYSITADMSHRGNYQHDHSVSFDMSNHHDNLSLADGEEVTKLLRDLMHWIYDSLKREHDWLLSDEQVDESIIINEYEFDEAGNRY